MAEPTIDPLALQDIRDTYHTIMVAIAGFTVLVWDHVITFDDEVELVWKRDKGLLVYLFLLNRYLTPLGFMVNLVAFTLPNWGIETCCARSCAMTVIGTQTAGFIMFLRVRALYSGNRLVIWSIILVFFVWLGVNAFLLTNGIAVTHPSGLHSCTMIFKVSLSNIASASAWLPLLFDTCVFLLTLYRTRCRSGHLVRTVLADGILYYSVICTVNVVLTIMIVRAGPSVKNITAQLELLLTVAMVSRITLNLRKQALGDSVFMLQSPSRPQLRTLRAALGMEATRSRSNTVSSSRPRPSMVNFRGEPISRPEDIQLDTIFSINVTPSESRV